MVEINRATEDQWALVREIRLRSLSSDPKSFGQPWERESAYDESVWRQRLQDAAWFLGLDENDNPVALVATRHEDDSPENERELQAMWVTPDARKSGIAGRLADAVIAWAREDGADTMTLYVGPTNDPARSLYSKLGFEDTGDRWEIDEDDPDGAWIKMARAI